MYADKNRKTSAVCLTVFVSPLNMKCLDRLMTQKVEMTPKI